MPISDGSNPDSARDTPEQIARTLLARYGVVFRRLLEQESLPPWRELVMVFRKLEASGEIRGGRFVGGFSGEQYALPEAVGLLREVRRTEKNGAEVIVSAADPLNLVGILTPGPRIPALTKNRILYRDGIAVAVYEGGSVRHLSPVETADSWHTRVTLERNPRDIRPGMFPSA